MFVPIPTTPVIIPIPDRVELAISWSPVAGAVYYQVYVDGSLAAATLSTSVMLPYPGEGSPITVQVGTVGPGEQSTDFAAFLPAAVAGSSGSAPRLTWHDGDLDTGGVGDVARFLVYRSPAPGQPVDYSREVAAVGASPGVASYSFQDGPRTRGTWRYGVLAVDSAGNAGAPVEVAVSIVSPPRPPARDTAGLRLEHTYSPSTRRVLLTWLASPDP